MTPKPAPGPVLIIHLISPDHEGGAQTILCNAAGAKWLRWLLLSLPHCAEQFGQGVDHIDAFTADGEPYTLTLRILDDEAMAQEVPPYVWQQSGNMDHWQQAREDEDERVKAEEDPA